MAPEEYEQRKKAVGDEIARLNVIYQEIMRLQERGLLEDTTLTRRVQLWHILGTSEESGLAMKLESLQSKTVLEELQNTLKPLILEAYELTSQILQDLNIISTVRVVMTHHTKTSFTRVANFELTADDVVLELRKGALALRVASSKVREKVMGGKTAREQSQTDISKHYRLFVADLQKTAVKPNWGVVAEAFERHWEQLEQHKVSPDWGGEGNAWQLYHASTGSAAYYTGPDTELSQVKSTNASIVSNINIVLNTMKAILQMARTQVIDPSNIGRIKNQYLKAFKQKSGAVEKDGEAFIDFTADGLVRLIQLDK